MSDSVQTEVYQTEAHTYMRAVAEMWLGRWWWAMIIPVAVCFGLGATVNVAFAFIGFMVIFLIAPMVIMFLYFAHALTAEARMAILPHQVEATDNGLTVTFVPMNEGDREFPAADIAWTDVKALEWRNHDIMIHLKGTPYRFLLIPYSAMNNQGEFTAACQRHAKTTIGINELSDHGGMHHKQSSPA